MLVDSVQIISHLDSQSKFQMFTLFPATMLVEQSQHGSSIPRSVNLYKTLAPSWQWNTAFLLFSSFFCPFVSYCFTWTLSSTPSKSQNISANIWSLGTCSDPKLREMLFYQRSAKLLIRKDQHVKWPRAKQVTRHNTLPEIPPQVTYAKEEETADRIGSRLTLPKLHLALWKVTPASLLSRKEKRNFSAKDGTLHFTILAYFTSEGNISLQWHASKGVVLCICTCKPITNFASTLMLRTDNNR